MGKVFSLYTKMSRLEQIEFENTEKLHLAIDKILSGEKITRDFKSGNETKTKTIINNNRLYVGNNLSLQVNKDVKTGKVYLAITYYSLDDRFEVAKHNKEADSKNEGL